MFMMIRRLASLCGGNEPFYGLEKKISTKESLYYIQALLNYWLLERVVKSKASTFRGNYYSHGKQFIAKLPIYRIDFDNIEETENKRTEKQVCRLIETESQHLDDLISRLYGSAKEYSNEK